MLTWAIVYHYRNAENYIPLLFIGAMICDVLIFAAIGAGIAGKCSL